MPVRKQSISTSKTISDNLRYAMTIFMDYYEPVSKLQDSDDQFSTDEIVDKMLEILPPDDISKAALFQLLMDNGYKYSFMFGFKWLFKIRRKGS